MLGLDVGREFVRGAVADLSGAVRTRESRPARSSSGAARVRELSRPWLLIFCATPGLTAEELLQTVVGSPGVEEPGRPGSPTGCEPAGVGAAGGAP